ncbi:MAG: hypothetical protein OHK0023_19120 [Anaerolineae bacterium]
MARSTGTLRRQTRDSGWQWLLIGLVLGLGCASVFCLAGYAAGLIVFNVPGQAPLVAANLTPTIIERIITATPEPATPTPPTSPTAQVSTGQSGGQPSMTPFTILPSPTGGVPAVLPTTGFIQVGTPIVTSPPQVGATLAAIQPTVDSTFSPTELVAVSGGSFNMGTDITEATRAIDDCQFRDSGANCNIAFTEDSIPAHPVTVNSFTIERYEVSYTQFVGFLNALGPRSHLNGCDNSPCAAIQGTNQANAENPNSGIRFDGTRYSLTSVLYENRPAAYVTWYGAQAYCRSIGRSLPTEAQWEYAARYSDGRIYPWGPAWDETRARTSRPTNVGGPENVDAFPTGQSALGIYNMAGNIAEWVFDWYGQAHYKEQQAAGNVIDPQGPAAGSRKVVRGGSWDALPLFARTVHRQDFEPQSAQGFVGFRCAGPAAASSSGGPPVAPGAATTPAALSSGSGN